MGIIEKSIISMTKIKLNKALSLDDIREISSEGLKEHRDIPYKNRSGKELLMDVFEPIVDKGTELPVIVNIHGGADFAHDGVFRDRDHIIRSAAVVVGENHLSAYRRTAEHLRGTYHTLTVIFGESALHKFKCVHVPALHGIVQ